MGLFTEIVDGFQLLTVFAKSSVLDLWQCFEFVTEFSVRGHPLSTYAKFSKKLTFLTPENFAYVLNGWAQIRRCHSLPYNKHMFKVIIQDWKTV